MMKRLRSTVTVYSGDLIYEGCLNACYTSTDPQLFGDEENLKIKGEKNFALTPSVINLC